MLWILDLKGSNRKCFPPKAVCKEALNIFYTHYPERCLTCFCARSGCIAMVHHRHRHQG